MGKIQQRYFRQITMPRPRRFLAMLFLLSTAIASALSVAPRAAEGPCQPSDVLWLWSGALTSRSITFKFGLREGYTCADSDFVLYAFPELLEGEKPHSAIASCSAVDGGEAGDGEERSPSSYDIPNVRECNLEELPHSDRTYRYELTLINSGEIVRSGSFKTPKEEGQPFNYRVAFASCADEHSDPKVLSLDLGIDVSLFLLRGNRFLLLFVGVRRD